MDARLSVLGVLEQGLPDVPNKGAFSLNYFPQYGGYFISAIGGEPAPGESKYSRLCLTPAGSGSTTIVLPIAPNKVLVGKDDTVVLAFDQDCPGTSASHAP